MYPYHSSRETSTFSLTSSLTSLSVSPTPPSFPSEFGFYKLSFSTTLLALTTKDPTPFASISLYNGFFNKPDITLYQKRGKYELSYEVASTRFTASGKPYITLGPTQYGAAPTEKVECYEFFQVVHHFTLYLPSLGSRERFEWQACCRSELRILGHSKGMKLVRIKTGEVMALYAKVSCARKKVGKMRFLNGNGDRLGKEFQVMAVMSSWSILEAEKRNKERMEAWRESYEEGDMAWMRGGMAATSATCPIIAATC